MRAMKKVLIVIAVLLVLLIIGSVVKVLSNFRPAANFNFTSPPKVVKAHFMPLETVDSISKFRSGAGHDFSDNTSPCSSMKHYFQPPTDEEYQKTHSLPPPPDGTTDIPIVSPVDGTIRGIEGENIDFGNQIYINVEGQPGLIIRLFHIFPDKSVKRGLKVKAGDRLGVIGGHQGTDISVQAGFGPTTRFLSYFDVLPDSLFADYAKYGITARNQLQFSAEYRAAHPLSCQGEQFTTHGTLESGDFIQLHR